MANTYVATLGRQPDPFTLATTGHHILRRAGGGHEDSLALEGTGEHNPHLTDADAAITGRTTGYTHSGLFSALTWHYALECILGSTFSELVSIPANGGDVAAQATGNRLTSTTAGKFAPLTPGRYLELVGFPGATLPGGTVPDRAFALITARPDGQTLVLDPTTLLLADEAPAAPEARLIQGPAITDGITAHYSTLEEAFGPADFQVWFGLLCQSFSWNRPATGKITCEAKYTPTAGLEGNGAPATASILTQPPAEPTTTQVMTHAHINLLQAGQGLASLLTGELSYQLARTLVERTSHGTVGPVELDAGTLALTGQLNAYGTSTNPAVTAQIHQVIRRYQQRQPSSLTWYCRDRDNHIVLHRLPRVIYSGAPRQAGGENQAPMLNGPYRAFRDPAAGYLFLYQAFPPLT